jgi:hypothetical protein
LVTHSIVHEIEASTRAFASEPVAHPQIGVSPGKAPVSARDRITPNIRDRRPHLLKR